MPSAHHKEENSENDGQNDIDRCTWATNCTCAHIVTNVNHPSSVDCASNQGGFFKLIANPSGDPNYDHTHCKCTYGESAIEHEKIGSCL